MHAVARLAAGRIRIPTTHFLRLISMAASGRRAVVAESNSAGFLTACMESQPKAQSSIGPMRPSMENVLIVLVHCFGGGFFNTFLSSNVMLSFTLVCDKMFSWFFCREKHTWPRMQRRPKESDPNTTGKTNSRKQNLARLC